MTDAAHDIECDLFDVSAMDLTAVFSLDEDLLGGSAERILDWADNPGDSAVGHNPPDTRAWDEDATGCLAAEQTDR
jgi:hypothetical protein